MMTKQKKSKKIMLIGSFANEKFKYDGQRNKSSDIYRCMNDCYSIKKNEFKGTRILDLLKLLFSIVFIKFDYYFILKPPLSAKYLIKIFRMFKKNKKVVYYLIGYGIENVDYYKSIKYSDFSGINKIIVETEAVKARFIENGFSNIYVYGCLKNTNFVPKEEHYEAKDTLEAIFFSRVAEEKGIFELIDAVKKINQDSLKVNLTISGMVESQKTLEKLSKAINERGDISFIGTSICSSDNDIYIKLNKYDLHVFPTKFKHECFPGSVVDFLAAGVPTLASNYDNYRYLLDEKFAYIYKQELPDSLFETLNHIFNNQQELFYKRQKSFAEFSKHNYDSFRSFLKSNDFFS